MSDGVILKQIRSRKTYKLFKSWLDYLNTNPTKEDILFKVHETIDDYRGFRYCQQSCYAKESIEQVIHDAKEQEDGIPKGK